MIISGIYYPGGGLTYVMRNLALRLNSFFEVVCFGFDPNPTHHDITKTELCGCPLYVFPMRGNSFFVDRMFLRSFLGSFDPRSIITLGPMMFNESLLVQLQEFKSTLRTIAYAPVEGKLSDPYFLTYMDKVDFCAFYTENVLRGFKELAEANDYYVDERKFAVIGHGVDADTFYPMEAKSEKERRKHAREIIYPRLSMSDDALVILNISRPYLRKKMEVTLDGFKLFAEDKEDVYLHLHLGGIGSETIQEYHGLVAELGLEGKVIITPDPEDPQIKPVHWLNTLYNACDIGLSTAMGEGWGLGLFEHAATRAAILAPKHTSFEENWSAAGVLMPWSGTQYIFYEQCDMFIVAAEEVCKGLNDFYFDRDLLNEVAIKCFERSKSSDYSWDSVAAKFKRLILQQTAVPA